MKILRERREYISKMLNGQIYVPESIRTTVAVITVMGLITIAACMLAIFFLCLDTFGYVGIPIFLAGVTVLLGIVLWVQVGSELKKRMKEKGE